MNSSIEKHFQSYNDSVITHSELEYYLCKGLKNKFIINELSSYSETLKLLDIELELEKIIEYVEFARTNYTSRIFGGIYTYEILERGYKESTKQEYLDSLLAVIEGDLFFLDDEYKLKFVHKTHVYNKVIKALKELSKEERNVYISHNREKWIFLDKIMEEIT